MLTVPQTRTKAHSSPLLLDSPLLRPPLKWAGSKRWLIPHLLPLWQPHIHRRLVEPFCGGLAVSLGLSPERAQLNDLNPHVINFYRWLQQGLHTTLPLDNSRRLTRHTTWSSRSIPRKRSPGPIRSA